MADPKPWKCINTIALYHDQTRDQTQQKDTQMDGHSYSDLRSHSSFARQNKLGRRAGVPKAFVARGDGGGCTVCLPLASQP